MVVIEGRQDELGNSSVGYDVNWEVCGLEGSFGVLRGCRGEQETRGTWAGVSQTLEL